MLSYIQYALVRLTGHKPDRATAGPEDFGGLAKVGAAIVPAATLCAVNSGGLGWMLAENLTQTQQNVAAGVAACMGLAFVLSFDRAAVYLADTRPDMPRLTKLSYLGTRVVIVLTMGMFTAQAVMPVLLDKELQVQALRMQERSDAQRHTALSTRLGIGEKGVASGKAAARAQEAERLQSVVPADIAAALKAVQACRAQVQSQRERLQAEGLSVQDSRIRTATQAQACAARSTQAQAARDSHLRAARSAAQGARAQASAAASTWQSAQQEAVQRSGDSARIERAALTPRSSEVMAALLAENAGARFKWFLLSLLQLLLELMPLILKAFSGVSQAGREIALRHALADRRRHRTLSESAQEDTMFLAMKELSDRTAEAIAQSPAAQATMRAEHQRVFDAIATLEGAQRFMRVLADNQQRADDLNKRHAGLAATFSAAWHAAVQRAAAVMAGSTPTTGMGAATATGGP
jgi:Domain of unknown function (DUF4407)